MTLRVLGGRRMNELHPPVGERGANQYYFRFDRTRAVTLESSQSRPAWNVSSGGGASSLIRSQSGSQMVLSRPPAAAAVTVTDGRDTVILWFVSATLRINHIPGGHINPASNPSWPQILTYMRQTYGAPSYNFHRLGPIHFHAEIPTAGGHAPGERYGDFYEMAGHVEPRDIQSRLPITFVLLRRILGGTLVGEDVLGQTLPAARGLRAPTVHPGMDDTSLMQSGSLNGAGRLFDYDFPGSVMTSANQLGDQHVYALNFEGVVAIGSRGMANRATFWPETIRLGTDVSPLVRWRTRVVARCTQPSTGGAVGIEVSG